MNNCLGYEVELPSLVFTFTVETLYHIFKSTTKASPNLIELIQLHTM